MSSVRTHALDYIQPFDSSKLEVVKLIITFDDGTETRRPIKQFNGYGGMEALLYVKDAFDKLMRLFDVDADQLYTHFASALEGLANDQWQVVENDTKPEDPTAEDFEASVKQFYLEYSRKDARTTMYQYLRSDQVQKKKGATSREHANRLKLLIKYTQELPGTDPPWTQDQIKDCIFESFCEDWKTLFFQAGKDVASTSTTEIVEYMEMIRNLKDSKEVKYQKKRNREASHKNGNGNGSKTKNGNKKQAVDMCRKHNGGHPWSKCPDNPKGTNYRAPNGGGRGRGRNDHQGGRGDGGRGGFFNGGSFPHSGGRGFGRGGPRDQYFGGRGQGRGSGRYGSYDGYATHYGFEQMAPYQPRNEHYFHAHQGPPSGGFNGWALDYQNFSSH